MAVPTIVNSTSGTTVSGTSHTLNVPAVAAYETLLIFVTSVISLSGVDSRFPGWVEHRTAGDAVMINEMQVQMGSSAWSGTTATVTTGSATRLAYAAYTMRSAVPTGYPAGQYAYVGSYGQARAISTSTAPNCPSLSIGSTADFYLFAVYGWSGNAQNLTYPSSHTVGQQSARTTSGPAVGIAAAARSRTSQAYVTQDPGPAEVDADVTWQALTTIRFDPFAGPAVGSGNAGNSLYGAFP